MDEDTYVDLLNEIFVKQEKLKLDLSRAVLKKDFELASEIKSKIDVMTPKECPNCENGVVGEGQNAKFCRHCFGIGLVMEGVGEST